MVGRKYNKIKQVFSIVLLINLFTMGLILMKNASVYYGIFPNSNEKINNYFGNIRAHYLDQHQISKAREKEVYGEQGIVMEPEREINKEQVKAKEMEINRELVKEKEIYTEQDIVNISLSNRPVPVHINDISTQYICTGLGGGRLANTLYMFASAYGIARSKGMKLSIPEGTQELESTFHLKGSFYKNKSVCDHVKTIPASGCCKFAQNIMDMPNNRSFRVSNYLQSYKYFEKYHDEVRSILTFRDKILKNATSKLESLLSAKYGGQINRYSLNRTLVGVHIRRGDYLLKDKQKFGYKVATKEYIHSAMEYMRSKYSNITFIVCSLDLKWVKDVVSGMIDVTIAPIGSGINDLALLSIMDHTIITVGTYGFWAAWLNKSNGTVIYYKDFKVPNSRYARGFANPDTDTYFPYWIGM